MLQNLEQHIGQLLYSHECVVVPNFGAFLTQSHPAEVNSATFVMRPPSKRVSFNSRIKQNDGLLAKHVSNSEGLSYKDALAFIDSSVKEWEVGIQSGKKLNLNGIGRLYLSLEGKVQFSPAIDINYDAAFYGLSIFRSPAVHREVEIRKTIHKAIEKHTVPAEPTKAAKNPPLSTKALPILRWAAVLGPVLALTVASGIYVKQNEPFKNLSGLRPMLFMSSAPSESITELQTPAKVNEPIKVEASEGEVITEAPVSVEPETVVETAPEGSVDLTISRAGFHVVVGSFKENRNAINYIKDLKARGYDAYLAEGSNDFSRVAIGHFSTKSDAQKILGNIQRDVTSGAWIYSN